LPIAHSWMIDIRVRQFGLDFHPVFSLAEISNHFFL
jgi:hypothetical protein